MVVAPYLTVKPHIDWALVTEPSVHTMRSCGLLLSWMEAWSLTPFCLLAISDSAFPNFLAGASRLTWRPESVRVPFPLLGLLELCQLHTCSIESSAWPIQDLPRPSLHPSVSFTASWSGLWRFSTAPKYLWPAPFSVCISGRSSMNLVVSVVQDIHYWHKKKKRKKKTVFFIASDRHATKQNLVLQPVLNWANVCSRSWLGVFGELPRSYIRGPKLEASLDMFWEHSPYSTNISSDWLRAELSCGWEININKNGWRCR